MTDEEFKRIKAAEKERLQAERQHRKLLGASERRGAAQSVVRGMKQRARRLLAETESFVDTLRRHVARGQARLEVALGENSAPSGLSGSTLSSDEEALREARADELIRQYRAASGGEQRAGRTDETNAERYDSSGPDKTIGRMPTGIDDDSGDETSR